MQLHESTPSARAFHEARKAREARIASAAARLAASAAKPVAVPVIVVMPEAKPDPAAAWAERQKKIPLPKTVTAIKIVRKYPAVSTIQKIVSKHFDVSLNDLRSVRRGRLRITRPRQIVNYLAREYTAASYPEIGRQVGGRDHTTVINSVKKIFELLPVDPEIAHDVAHLEEAVKAMLPQVAA